MAESRSARRDVFVAKTAPSYSLLFGGGGSRCRHKTEAQRREKEKRGTGEKDLPSFPPHATRHLSPLRGMSRKCLSCKAPKSPPKCAKVEIPGTAFCILNRPSFHPFSTFFSFFHPRRPIREWRIVNGEWVGGQLTRSQKMAVANQRLASSEAVKRSQNVMGR